MRWRPALQVLFCFLLSGERTVQSRTSLSVVFACSNFTIAKGGTEFLPVSSLLRRFHILGIGDRKHRVTWLISKKKHFWCTTTLISACSSSLSQPRWPTYSCHVEACVGRLRICSPFGVSRPSGFSGRSKGFSGLSSLQFVTPQDEVTELHMVVVGVRCDQHACNRTSMWRYGTSAA